MRHAPGRVTGGDVYHVPVSGRVCAAQDVINGDIVKVSQRTQYLRRGHPLAALIIRIRALGDVDGLADLPLGQVRDLPQVPYTRVSHGSGSKVLNASVSKNSLSVISKPSQISLMVSSLGFLLLP